MWNDFSIGFIKKNRASSLSIMVAALISSLFLSFLCTMFYNFWAYEVGKIVIEEGDWQGRITGEIDEEDLFVIRSFANVGRAVVNEELSTEQGTVVDLYFENAKTIYADMPLITERLGMEKEAASYHTLLLSQFLIHDPQDESPPLLLVFYLGILLLVSVSLILIIHNSFAVSMNARVRQFGILSSVGATPGQIRTCLLQEAAVLCAAPVLLGNLLGTALSYGAVQRMEVIAADMPGRYDIGFHYHMAVSAVTVMASALTVLFSAWLPAYKLSRLTPLEAVRGTGVSGLKRRRNSLVLGRLFGIEGELAGNALKAQKKALRTATLSLTLSFLGFAMMLCLFSLTDLSTRYTYFERYQDVWDVMVTIKDTRIEDFGQALSLDREAGVEDLVVYQKAEAVIQIPESSISPELAALGGPEAVAGSAVSGTSAEGSDVSGPEAAWQVKAPVVVLDDTAFTRYCKQLGLTPRLDGTIILNRIWDSLNSVFRSREYVPFIKEDRETIVLQNASGTEGAAEIPVTGFTREAPALKEEYADYALVQFVPLSLWKQISGQIGGTGNEVYIRILGREGITHAELIDLEKGILRQLGHSYEVESENRIEEKVKNDRILGAYKLVMGSFCCLLAMIGIANVFSYTFGFLRQRRREIAQYMSAGMTPAGLRRMFCVEAFVIAGRPILITLPLTYFFVEFTARASYLNPAEVWREIPVGTITGFSLAVIGFVGLAYYLGGRKAVLDSLAEALKDELF